MPPPNDSLYIKGLPAGFGDADVRRIFGAYGEVLNVRIVHAAIYNDETIAIVKFGRLEQSSWLVQNVNGNIPQGLTKPVVIKYADPPGYRKSKGAGQDQRYSPYGGGKGGGYDASSLDPTALQALADAINGMAPTDGSGPLKTTAGASTAPAMGGVHDPSSLYVKDLPLHVDDLWLYKVFAPHGAIEKVRAMPREDGVIGCKGIGFVKFVRADEAATAIARINGHPTFDGSCISVAVKTPKRAGGKGTGKEVWGVDSGQTPSSVTLAGAAPAFAQTETGFATQEGGWTQGWDATAVPQNWDVAAAEHASWDATTPGQSQWDSAYAEQASWTAATTQAPAALIDGSAVTSQAVDIAAASTAPAGQPAI